MRGVTRREVAYGIASRGVTGERLSLAWPDALPSLTRRGGDIAPDLTSRGSPHVAQPSLLHPSNRLSPLLPVTYQTQRGTHRGGPASAARFWRRAPCLRRIAGARLCRTLLPSPPRVALYCRTIMSQVLLHVLPHASLERLLTERCTHPVGVNASGELCTHPVGASGGRQALHAPGGCQRFSTAAR